MYPEFLRDIREFQVIEEIIQPELDMIDQFREEVIQSTLVATSSEEALDLWESPLKLPKVKYEHQRLDLIMSKMMNNQPITDEWLARKLVTYISSGIVSHAFDYKKDHKYLLIHFTETTNQPLDYIYRELKRLIGAHIIIKILSTPIDKTKLYAGSIYREYRKETVC